MLDNRTLVYTIAMADTRTLAECQDRLQQLHAEIQRIAKNDPRLAGLENEQSALKLTYYLKDLAARGARARYYT